MDTAIIGVLAGIALGVLACAAQIRQTYREGVLDGWGYAHKPMDREHEVAGRIIKEHFPQLREPIRGKAYRPYVEHWGDN